MSDGGPDGTGQDRTGQDGTGQDGTGQVGTGQDPFALERFVRAQEGVHDQALAELRRGRKTTHWMWFVFPQIAGLGGSPTARHYAVSGHDEARAYLAHPLLGRRLREAAAVAADAPGDDVQRLLGPVDALKLRSSMTLFAMVADDPEPFLAVLARWYDGADDPLTRQRLGN